MQLILEATKPMIDTGDIVDFRGTTCLVAYFSRSGTSYDYPALLIDIDTGKVVDAYKALNYLSRECKLLLKGKDAVITRRKDV